MVIKFDLIAAACENMGIGKNKDLPWRLKSEMAYFNRMTTETCDPNKRNVVVMGRVTWDCIPKKFVPLPNRINFVLSRSNELDLSQYKDVYTFQNFDQLVDALQSDNFKNLVENVWIIGGTKIYQEAMNSKHFHRLYLTKILKTFDCDTFFPKLSDDLVKVEDPRVSKEIQEENGIQYVFHVYENPNYSH